MKKNYFEDSEFACQGDSKENIKEFGEGCGCNFSLPEGGINPLLRELANEVREKAGVPIYINCGYRCQFHNDRLPGSVPNSQHVDGTAIDMDAREIGVDTLADITESCGADGVGRYYKDAGTFVHGDVRSGKIGDNYRW